MPRPTKDDAKLILKLVELGQSEDQREAFRWLMSEFSAKDYDEFQAKYAPGSEDLQRVTRLLGFFETIGVLVSHGLLNEDLVFDLSFGMDPVWEKLGPIIPGWREQVMPALWENAVWLHDRYAEWQKKVWKPNLKWKLKSGARKK